MTRLDLATLGLRALYELDRYDDSLDLLCERAERALAGLPGKHHAGIVAEYGRMQRHAERGVR